MERKGREDMGKFKKSFVSAAREELEKEAEQKRLHGKHREIDEKMVIVEKDNTFQFTLRMLERVIRFAALTVLLVFTTIGILSLVYPEVRKELLEVFWSILQQAKGMLGI